MLVRIPTKHLRHTLQRSTTTRHHSLSYVISTNNDHLNVINSDDSFVSYDVSNLNFSEKSAKPVALETKCQFLQHGSLPSPYTLSKSISFCAKSGNFDMGIQLHSVSLKMGFCSNVHICSTLVDMYGKCGEIESAQQLFEEMPERNTVTWNSLISGYLNVKCPEVAIEVFLRMVKENVEMSATSVSSAFVACSQLGMGEVGVQVHALSLKAGFDDNVVVGTGLIDMYAKSRNVECSRQVFDSMMERNIITWNCMVSGYAQNQKPYEGMIVLKEMLLFGYSSNYVAYNSLLSSCSGVDGFHQCEQIHCRVIKEGLESNSYIAVSLVIAYSECGCNLEQFKKVTAGVADWDQISFNAVIAGYTNLEHAGEALRCFSEMRLMGIDVDYFTFTSILKAIGIISALEEGKKIHALVFKTGYTSNVCVQNGLVSMYARCGAIKYANMVFWSIRKHDVVSWNSLISGCAHHGLGREAVKLFEEMITTGIKPNGTTFLSLLTACSHAGLLNKALECFNYIRHNNLLEHLTTEHYASFVDLFGRAGNLYEAETLVSNMPVEPGPSVYRALLNACKVHGNKEIAVRVAKRLRELYPNDCATYILLANMLATEGYWHDAAEMHKFIGEKGVTKKCGYSWV